MCVWLLETATHTVGRAAGRDGKKVGDLMTLFEHLDLTDPLPMGLLSYWSKYAPPTKSKKKPSTEFLLLAIKSILDT